MINIAFKVRKNRIKLSRNEPNFLKNSDILAIKRLFIGYCKNTYIQNLMEIKNILKLRLSQRTDDFNKDLIDELLEKLKEFEAKMHEFLTFQFTARLHSFGTGFIFKEHGNFSQNLKNVFGHQTQVLMPDFGDKLEFWIEQNVSLIKGVNDDFRTKLQTEIISSYQNGGRWEGLKSGLQNIADFTESRTNLISKDQLFKLKGQVDRAEQENIGVEEFMWRTAGDAKVRSTHKEHDGKVYSWKNGANGMFPGQDYNCRCIAVPVFRED